MPSGELSQQDDQLAPQAVRFRPKNIRGLPGSDAPDNRRGLAGQQMPSRELPQRSGPPASRAARSHPKNIQELLGPGTPNNRRNPGGRQMPRRELPQRDPFIGPPAIYRGAPADVVERFADAIQEWADQPAETSRCRGGDSSGTGRTNGAEA